MGRPTRRAKQRVQAANAPNPWMGCVRPATRCRFWIAAQMVVMTERGVPMQRSSQDRLLRVSGDMGRMRFTAPQATAHVMTTAQLSQFLARMEGWEWEGHKWVLKASVSSWMLRAGRECKAAATAAQFPSADSNIVGAAEFSTLCDWRPWNVGASVSAAMLMNGMPELCDQAALGPSSAPSPMRTAARNAICAGASTWVRRGGMGCGWGENEVYPY